VYIYIYNTPFFL